MTSRFKEFPGTSLRKKDFADGKVLFVHDELKADFAWDTGVGIGTYLAGLKRGVILGSHCGHCHKTVVPPRVVCEWCFRPMTSKSSGPRASGKYYRAQLQRTDSSLSQKADDQLEVVAGLAEAATGR